MNRKALRDILRNCLKITQSILILCYHAGSWIFGDHVTISSTFSVYAFLICKNIHKTFRSQLFNVFSKFRSNGISQRNLKIEEVLHIFSCKPISQSNSSHMVGSHYCEFASNYIWVLSNCELFLFNIFFVFIFWDVKVNYNFFSNLYERLI